MIDLTAKEQIAYQAIHYAAANDQPCPVNIELEFLMDCDSTSMGPWIIARLEQKGVIIVRRFQRFREVYVVELNKWTARHPSMHQDKPHVPRGLRSRGGRPTDRKPYKAKV